MFKTLLKFISAPVAIVAALLVGTEQGRKLTRTVVKETVKGAVTLTDNCKQLFDETEEKSTKLIGQVKDSTSNIVDKVKSVTADAVEEARAEIKAEREKST
jgi:gas vesicle protein